VTLYRSFFGAFEKCESSSVNKRALFTSWRSPFQGHIVSTASVAVSPTPRAIGWLLKLSMSWRSSSPAEMSARILSITQ
jgi:hypothetical protein